MRHRTCQMRLYTHSDMGHTVIWGMASQSTKTCVWRHVQQHVYMSCRRRCRVSGSAPRPMPWVQISSEVLPCCAVLLTPVSCMCVCDVVRCTTRHCVHGAVNTFSTSVRKGVAWRLDLAWRLGPRGRRCRVRPSMSANRRNSRASFRAENVHFLALLSEQAPKDASVSRNDKLRFGDLTFFR